MSIKPQYAKQIFNGTKKFEFRKVIPYDIEKVLVYSSSPKRRIVGYFVVDYILHDDPEVLWEKTKEFSGIDQNSFFRYFQNKKKGFAIKVRSYKKFEVEIDPRIIIENFTPPQSYTYLDREGFTELQDLLD